MLQKKKRLLIVHILLAAAFLTAFLGLRFYVKQANSRIYVIRNNQYSPEWSECSVSIESVKQWTEEMHGYPYGLQYDGTIFNFSGGIMSDWVIEVTLEPGCHVDSYWNGVLTFENDVITMTSIEDTNIVFDGDTRTFGFVLYTQSLNDVKEWRLTYHKPIKMTTLPVFSLLIAGIVLVLLVDVVRFLIWIRVKQLKAKNKEALAIINQSFLTFAKIIDAKDFYTKGHSLRVAVYSQELARRMGMPQKEQRNIFYVAMLHDIGKIGVPDAILKKPGKLTPEEWAKIQEHVSIGGDMLNEFTAISGADEGARYHHERYDGNGYSCGLKGEEIPLYARIIGVADAFDAMSSARCYRPSMEIEKIISEIKRCSGTQFDPVIAGHMLDMIEEKCAPVDLEECMKIAEKLLREES